MENFGKNIYDILNTVDINNYNRQLLLDEFIKQLDKHEEDNKDVGDRILKPKDISLFKRYGIKVNFYGKILKVNKINVSSLCHSIKIGREDILLDLLDNHGFLEVINKYCIELDDQTFIDRKNADEDNEHSEMPQIYPFAVAIIEGLEFFKILEQRGIKLKGFYYGYYEGWFSSAMFIFEYGDEEMIKYFIDNYEIKSFKTLKEAFETNNHEYLLEKHPHYLHDPIENEMKAIHKFILEGNLEAVKYLYAQGSSLNIVKLESDSYSPPKISKEVYDFLEHQEGFKELMKENPHIKIEE